MKYVLSALFAFTSILTFAQSKYSISGYVTPGLSSNRVTHVDASNQDNVNYQENVKVLGFGFNTGLSVNKQVSNKFGYSFGLGYTKYSNSFQLTAFNVPFTNIQETQSIKLRKSYNTRYIDIPFNLNYTLYSKGKYTIKAIGGFEVNLPLKTKIITQTTYLFTSNTETQSETLPTGFDGVDDLNLTYMAGIRFEKKINENFKVDIQPTFREQLIGNSWSNPERVSNAFGLSLGITYNL